MILGVVIWYVEITSREIPWFTNLVKPGTPYSMKPRFRNIRPAFLILIMMGLYDLEPTPWNPNHRNTCRADFRGVTGKCSGSTFTKRCLSLGPRVIQAYGAAADGEPK